MKGDTVFSHENKYFFFFFLRQSRLRSILENWAHAKWLKKLYVKYSKHLPNVSQVRQTIQWVIMKNFLIHPTTKKWRRNVWFVSSTNKQYPHWFWMFEVLDLILIQCTKRALRISKWQIRYFIMFIKFMEQKQCGLWNVLWNEKRF